MANKVKFVNDFRTAIGQMLDSYDHVMSLVAQHKAMGWRPEEFIDAVANDITPDEFNAAMTARAGLTEGFAPVANILAKMRS